MPESAESPDVRASIRVVGPELEVDLAGSWRLHDPRLRWAELVGSAAPGQVRVRAADLVEWDSSILLFVDEVVRWCGTRAIPCDLGALPEAMRRLLGQLEAGHAAVVPAERTHSLLTAVGISSRHLVRHGRGIFQFIGECVQTSVRILIRPSKFRWRDCASEMQQCGAMALPIVSLISFLVGLTLGYSGAVVLRRFGGDIYIADIIGVAMTREMGAVMAAIVLAGRTGAAFAAQLGSMKANEEIDALATLGISPVRFLVLPRIVALGLMMPLLTIYANCLGIIGGMVVAYGVLDISPTAYWVEMLTIVDVPDVAVGLIKAVAFGLIVGISGCLRGLQAERSAAGVGRAATSAVVTAILFIILADAVFAVIFQTIGL
jgi:phospholipid/cholesterol/gamma-HCH transport system permease protein